MPVREAQIKVKILEALNALPECYAISYPGTEMRRGQPDIIGCWRGRMLALEVKAMKAKGATPLQLQVLRKWSQAGAVSGVVRSVEETMEMLEYAMAPSSHM